MPFVCRYYGALKVENIGRVVRVFKHGMPYSNIIFILNNIITPFCKRNTFSALTNHVNIRDYHRYNHAPGSSVGIATRYGLDGPGIESRCGGRDFPYLSRSALVPTQPPVQWVPGLSRG